MPIFIVQKLRKLGEFNLAAYCQRKYRGRGPKEPWYILTSLNSLPRTLSVYAARWGIETMFRDLKTGGYNLENTKVNERRLMALVLVISIAYTLATLQGASLQHRTVAEYICRPTETGRSTERHSTFWMGIARSRLGSIFPELVGFSRRTDESQTPQTTQFSTRASCFISAPEFFVGLLSPLEQINCILFAPNAPEQNPVEPTFRTSS